MVNESGEILIPANESEPVPADHGSVFKPEPWTSEREVSTDVVDLKFSLLRRRYRHDINRKKIKDQARTHFGLYMKRAAQAGLYRHDSDASRNRSF